VKRADDLGYLGKKVTMNVLSRLAAWLETHWVTPAYSGWLLIGLTLFFFTAATNTLAGWLYVISGISVALLAIAALLPERTLRPLQIRRSPIAPVSVGDALRIELWIDNPTPQPKFLLQVQDQLPAILGQTLTQSIEQILPHTPYHWVYEQPTQQRGIYRWHAVNLRTAAPLGLFWCRRSRSAKATAVVYPTVLTLAQCPLVDAMGREENAQLSRDRRTQAANQGLTRSLRPYRWGDSTRLIHWRTSARYGELRVREMEVFTGGQDLVICLDSAMPWRFPDNPYTLFPENFEQAVIAAASLYFYAGRCHLKAKLWTAGTGLVQGNQAVLEVLAATRAGEEVHANSLPDVPIVWLTQNPDSLATLPPGSRWLLWTHPGTDAPDASPQRPTHTPAPGVLIQPDQDLGLQLQRSLTSPRSRS
jgi:uncharacterized protein (DUF58 family)